MNCKSNDKNHKMCLGNCTERCRRTGELLESIVPQPHWTARHIVKDGDEFVGYDEAGLEHCRSRNRDDVVANLAVYAFTLEHDLVHLRNRNNI